MAKGFFTQGVAILLRQGIDISELRECLADHKIVKELGASADWQLRGPSLVIEYRPQVNGYLSADVVGHTWPDHMGTPKEEAMLFSAWAMGHFGPYAYPNGLRRACEQCWRWKEAGEAVEAHRAFVRLMLSYVFGTPENAPVMPKECDPVDELTFLTGMARALLKHPDSSCYFNPGGEVLSTLQMIDESVKFHADNRIPPFDIWCNVRLFNLSDGWLLMDCVGNWQFDIPDQEVVFPVDAFSPQEVDQFIRNASLYVLRNGMVIRDGDTMDGPGCIRWQAKQFGRGLSDPPRSVLRWLPVGRFSIPAAFTQEPAE